MGTQEALGAKKGNGKENGNRNGNGNGLVNVTPGGGSSPSCGKATGRKGNGTERASLSRYR